MKVKLFFQWLARRSTILLTALLFGGAIFFIWVLISGTPLDETTTTILATISIFFAAISAFASLLQAVEAQRQREDQERPYVIAYFESSSNGAFYFVIENAGNSPAYDLAIRFSPSPIDYADRPLNEISLFSNTITFLPAEKSIRQIIGSSFRFFENNKPTKFSVNITYKSVYGELFHENIEHDLEYLRHTTLPGKLANDYLKDISEQLKNVARSLDKLPNLAKTPPIKKRKSKK